MCKVGKREQLIFLDNVWCFLVPYISQLLPNLSAALLKSNGPHLRVSCSEIFSAALSGKSNQCNALYLQINLILWTRHTLFVPSHQYKYTTFILSTGFVLCSSSLRQLASNRLDGRHMGCLFFHILNDRRICRIYGHRQKCLHFAPMHCNLGGKENDRKCNQFCHSDICGKKLFSEKQQNEATF